MKRLIGIALLAVSLAFGQTERGNITGTVTDNTGATIPNAAVTITDKATNTAEHVLSTSTGEYNAANLQPGAYRVEVSVSGFSTFILDNVVLTAGATVRADAELRLGNLSERVEVSAQPIQMQTEDARVSNAVQNRLVDELPLVVGGALRSPFDLVSTVPEAKGSGNALSLGGGPAASWSATLDGLSVNTNRSADATETAYLTPSVESITEFSVDTNGFKAEFGQAGGGVITFVSKSGTNAFHGTAYEFLRNDAFDARGFFAPTRSIYKQSDFGASAGGPVTMPKLYNGRNRTFFFVSYEGFRNRLGANGTVLTVPTPEMYNGDFSKWVNSRGAQIQIYDPRSTQTSSSGGFTRTPFPGNQIPVSAFSNVTKQIIPFAKAIAPNRPGLVPGTSGYISNNYVTNGGATESPTDKGSVKLDQNFGSNHHLGFLYNKTRYNSEPGPCWSDWPSGALVEWSGIRLPCFALSPQLRLDPLTSPL